MSQPAALTSKPSSSPALPTPAPSAQLAAPLLHHMVVVPSGPQPVGMPTLSPALLPARAPGKRPPQAAADAREPLPEDEAQLLAQADTGTTSVQDTLLSQLAPGAGAPATPEACPVNEPGTVDACGVAGAADAHPAGGAIWLLGLLPLLGAGGGGGDAPDPGPTTIYPTPLTPPAPGTGTPTINQPVEALHPIDSGGDDDTDDGQLLANFDSNQASAVFSVKRVVDAATGAAVTGRYAEDNGAYDPDAYAAYDDPATDPWFYLDTASGELYLTAAGAKAQCIGQSFTVTVQAVANGITSAEGSVTFTLTAPDGETVLNHGWTGVGSGIDKAAPNLYDVLEITSPITQFHVFMDTEGTLLIQTQPDIPASTTTLSMVADHLLTNSLEYVSFNDLSYEGYSLGDKDASTNYFKVATSLTASPLPGSSSLTGSGLVGTDCNDLLFNNATFSIERFFGDNGNDLMFVGPDDGRNLGVLQRYADGGAGNDLLVGSSGSDHLYGGEGNDVLIGGAGADTFVFNTATGAAHADTVADFEAGIDTIMLDGRIFDGIEGDLSNLANWVTYNSATGALSYDETVFATLTGAPDLTLDNMNFMIA